MRILVTGASGLIGTALVPALREDGHEVTRLVRRAPTAADEARWDPANHVLDPALVAETDAVIHLSGAGVGDRRWSEQYRRTLRDSRIESTRTVAAALAAAPARPRVLLAGSAVGWYGDTGDRVVEESAPAGTGFFAELCRDWEAATRAAVEAGVRVVNLRTGLVCAPGGGLLGKLAPLFKAGLGGRLGSGRQYTPWISLRDVLGIIRFLLATEELHGPVNLTGPEPVTNAEFTRLLAATVHRPAVLPVPRVALRIAVGEFADEGVLAGQRAVPAVLLRHEYPFQDEDAAAALSWALAH
jgi:uncharacterized protein (TIGR01777 family)